MERVNPRDSSAINARRTNDNLGEAAMGKSATTLTIRGTRGDDPNLTIPTSALITQVLIDGNAGSDTLNLSSYLYGGVTIGLNSGAKAASYVTAKEFTGLFSDYVIKDSTTVSGTIKNVESLIGTSFNDSFVNSMQLVNKTLDGGGGNDRLVCNGGGTNLLIGGTGSDWLASSGAPTYVGGTYVNGVAPGDGEADYFLCSAPVTILDFEVGIDRLIIHEDFAAMQAFLNGGSWVQFGDTGSALMLNGVAEVTLIGVPLELAQTIDLGFTLVATSGRLEGSSGDDLLWSGPTGSVEFVFGMNSGNDIAAAFDILTDVLVFEDGIVPTWSDTLVNGAPALLGTWADGSVTIQGLGTDDLDDLRIIGVESAPEVGSAGPGPWSNNTDAAAYAGGSAAAVDAEMSAIALLAG